MRNINSKLQTLFATGGATGGTIIPARQSVARLTTVLFVVMSAMFILTGCGLGSLINAARTGNLPCNINPFQEKCYPEITEELLAGAATVITDDESTDLTDKEIADRDASIARRAAQEKARKEALEKYAPQRKQLIEPVVAECTVNPQAARCRDAFVWCSDFENTNSPECASALAAESGVFSCLKDPYNEACDQQTALQEKISGQVPVRDEETDDIKLDENGEEVTEVKTVTLVENTRQARINYCRGENDQGVPNIEIESNAVLCASTITKVCEDETNPSGVFDVFCVDDPDAAVKTNYEADRLRIATACRNDETPTVEEGCTSVVNFCNETPFGNSNCDIPAFAPARAKRVELCINASTTAETNACGIELANNPCFGDPFTDSVDCTDELNLGSPENVKTAKQNRSVLCVNAFIASRYPDICGGASANEPCVTDPFGDCADGLGTEGQISARQERALYCVIGTKTEDPLCAGIQMEECFIDPADDACTLFFGTTYTYLDENDVEKTGQQQDRAQSQRGRYCATFLQTEGRTETTTLCEATFVNYCETGQNLFRDSSNLGTPACLSRTDYDDKRLQFVNECRSGMRTTECGAENSVINACNSEPFENYQGDVCAPKHFDEARSDKIAACLVTGATGCEITFRNPNAATWAKSFSDNSTPLVALNTSAPENQFLLGTADGIPTTGTSATATLLTIEDDAKNGVGFFTANSKFYAGLFNGANLGKPLNNVAQAGEWTGSLQATVDTNLSAVLPMTLTVTYANNGGTIKAFVTSGSNHFLLKGDFTANGVITNGTVNYGIFTGGAEATPMDNRGTNGILMGLIGQDGALGAFHSNESETNGYAGGFVATKPAE